MTDQHFFSFTPAIDGSDAPCPTRTGLVLGGGGSAGNAWLIGVIAGLADAGADVTDADLVVGTSAGATAAAQITGAPAPARLLADILEVPQQRPGTAGGPRPSLGVEHLERTGRVIAASSDAADMRRRMGAAAIELAESAAAGASPGTAGVAGGAGWRETVAARLPSTDWPERRILLTAVDADTGEAAVLDRDSGVDLVDAVAASTAGGPAYRVGDRWLIDGGYRRNENADLAAGYERVLVLSPLGGRTRMPLDWRYQLDAQVEELRASGSRVEVILPDAASLEAFGPNMMNPATRPPAARAGFAQGVAEADRVRALWG